MSTSASAFGGFVAGLIALGTPDGGQSHGVGTRCLVSDLQASVAGRPRLLMSQWCLVARRALPFSITSPTSNRPRPSFRRPSPSATVMSPTAPDPTTSRCSRHRSKMGRPFLTSLLCAGRRTLCVLGPRSLLVRLSARRRTHLCVWLRWQHRVPACREMVRVRSHHWPHVRRAEWRVNQFKGVLTVRQSPPLRSPLL